MQPIELQNNEQRTVLLLNPASAEYRFVQKSGSSLTVHLFCLDDRDADISIYVDQAEEGCTTEIYGLAVTCGSQHNSCHTVVRHLCNNGVSRQLFKYILAGTSNAEFNGELIIVKDAQGNDAQQSNRNLLLSDKAKITTKPQLQIYADDVKASHGASTGQLDQSSVFYMQQRGISRQSAVKLLVSAFAEEVATTISDAEQQDNIRAAIEERLNRLI